MGTAVSNWIDPRAIVVRIVLSGIPVFRASSAMGIRFERIIRWQFSRKISETRVPRAMLEPQSCDDLPAQARR